MLLRGMNRSCMLLLLAGCASDYEVVPEPVEVHPGDVTPCDFTRVEGTAFWAYDCNPVFTTTGEDWAGTIGSTAFAVTEVAGHPFYQLWYAGLPSSTSEGRYGLGYAVSPEGIGWEVYPDNPLLSEPSSSSAWDASNMDQLVAVWDDDTGQYVILYQGYNLDPFINTWGLGVLTSTDGRSWSRSSDQAAFDLTQSVGQVSSWCWPLGLSLRDGGGYTGYIAGQTGNVVSIEDIRCEVYTLEADDVSSWQPSTDRFLAAGSSGSWDDQGFGSIAVAELDGTDYLFYQGFGGWQQLDGYISSQDHFFGMATRTGSGWQKAGDPIPLNTTTEGDVGSVAAHTIGDRIHLWITDAYDGSEGVGYFLFDPIRAEEEDAR